ncbi:Cnga4 [Symbiodinium necroappetens]|uniref:Cnga4 protein n=1 Tax=Symbiodinium necroappetens TaxID=1628268 RepID=A0A813B690_9DINO|nr:Cnga4 [Symbiodinium necroappetens]
MMSMWQAFSCTATTAGKPGWRRRSSPRCSQFISADASYQSSAQSHIVAVDTDTDTKPQKSWVCMLHPSGGLRTSWNLLVALCVLYDLLVIPLAVFDLPESSLSQALDIGIQAFWNLDFGLAFLTGFYDQGSLVMDRVAVARQYAKTWMVFDLFLILMDWSVTVMDHVTLTGNPAEWSRTIRMLRLLRLVRIVRAIKLRRGFVADLLHSQAASLYLSFYVSLGPGKLLQLSVSYGATTHKEPSSQSGTNTCGALWKIS